MYLSVFKLIQSINCGLFNDTVIMSDYAVSNDVISNKLKRIRKETVKE